MLHHGDCLEVLPTLDAGCVALIYADPPFASGRNYVGTAGAFTDTWLSMDAYLDYMRERLVAMRRVLSPTGSIYLHCDDTACHRLRCVMDDVFGASAFKSQIAWKRANPKGNATRMFGRIVDTILLYARPEAVYNPQYVPLSPASVEAYSHNDHDGKGPYQRISLSAYDGAQMYEWKGWSPPKAGWKYDIETMQALHDDGRIYYPQHRDGTPDHGRTIRLKHYLSSSKGSPVGNLWSDIERAGEGERVDYPTQKPLALLERIVAASSAVGDLVFDPFMGSGTTLVAAKRLGRRFGGCDVSADAITAATARLDGEVDGLPLAAP